MKGTNPMTEGCLMIKLEPGNVLLKPSQRKQLMGWLRRSLRLGERLGNFLLTITFRRVGKMFDIRANVSDSYGSFSCHFRRHDWRTALREMIRTLSIRLHDQCLRRAMPA
jgi:hypothetical protein